MTPHLSSNNPNNYTLSHDNNNMLLVQPLIGVGLSLYVNSLVGTMVGIDSYYCVLIMTFIRLAIFNHSHHHYKHPLIHVLLLQMTDVLVL